MQHQVILRTRTRDDSSFDQGHALVRYRVQRFQVHMIAGEVSRSLGNQYAWKYTFPQGRFLEKWVQHSHSFKTFHPMFHFTFRVSHLTAVSDTKKDHSNSLNFQLRLYNLTYMYTCIFELPLPLHQGIGKSVMRIQHLLQTVGATLASLSEQRYIILLLHSTA